MKQTICRKEIALEADGKYDYWVNVPAIDVTALVSFNVKTKRWDWEYETGTTTRKCNGHVTREAAIKDMFVWLGYKVTG